MAISTGAEKEFSRAELSPWIRAKAGEAFPDQVNQVTITRIETMAKANQRARRGWDSDFRFG